MTDNHANLRRQRQARVLCLRKTKIAIRWLEGSGMAGPSRLPASALAEDRAPGPQHRGVSVPVPDDPERLVLAPDDPAASGNFARQVQDKLVGQVTRLRRFDPRS